MSLDVLDDLAMEIPLDFPLRADVLGLLDFVDPMLVTIPLLL